MKVIGVFFCRFLKFQVKLGEIFTKIKNFFFFFFFEDTAGPGLFSVAPCASPKQF